MKIDRDESGTYFCIRRGDPSTEPPLLETMEMRMAPIVKTNFERLYRIPKELAGKNHVAYGNIGDSRMLSCTVEAVPVPTISWFKEELVFVDESRAQSNEQGSNLPQLSSR